MNRPGWRRVGAVLRCRLDVRLAIGREVRRDDGHDPQTLSADELLELFLQPDPDQDGMAAARSPRSFSE